MAVKGRDMNEEERQRPASGPIRFWAKELGPEPVFEVGLPAKCADKPRLFSAGRQPSHFPPTFSHSNWVRLTNP